MNRTRTVEIDDTLQDRVDGAIEEARELLEEYLRENPDFDEPPCLWNDLDYSGAVHDIIDTAVPVYTREIEDTWYLHSNALEAAYNDAGIGNNPRENSGMAAIYCYIEQQVSDWYNENASEIFEAVRDARETETD